MPQPPPAGAVAARSRIEAESFTGSQGEIVRGEMNIGSLNGGEWVKYGQSTSAPAASRASSRDSPSPTWRRAS